MRTTEIIATLAVAGTVATFAILNLNSAAQGSSFLAVKDEVTASFNGYLAKYRKSFGTQEEYNYRLQIFSQNYH